LDEYNILAVGAGPCNELIGVLNYMERSAVSKKVTYLGVEKNNIWQAVQGNLKSIVRGLAFQVNIKIIDDDIFNVIARIRLNRMAWKPNLLILNYVISDMVKNGANMDFFIEEIVQKIIPNMPIGSSVILNDINHNTKARDYFDKFAAAVNEKYLIEINKGHFVNNNRWYYSYGTRRSTNSITQTIPANIVLRYSPWAFCSSAHMIVNILGERSI